MKNFFKTGNLPFSVVYGLESPDDMINSLNTLFSECIERHAPLKRVKLTHTPVLWMSSDEIRELQVARDKLRFEAHTSIVMIRGRPSRKFVIR